MSTMTTTPDIPLLITSPSSSSERRITPSWTIATLKAKLELVTGIPPSSMRLALRGHPTAGDEEVPIQAADEETTTLEGWRLGRGMEIYVHDSRPPSLRPNFTDASLVPKYSLPPAQYASLPNSVLAWKKSQKLGRFDPSAPSKLAAQSALHERVAAERGIAVGRRCQVGGDDGRRGTVRYVGEVEEIPGAEGGWWVGVELDEPVGRNDGGVGGRRYFDIQGGKEGGGGKKGVFVRPERVEVGDFPALEDLEELEEI